MPVNFLHTISVGRPASGAAARRSKRKQERLRVRQPRFRDQELAEEKRFRQLVDSVTDQAIFMLTPEGTIASCNVGAERIEGYRAEEIVGKHFSIF